MTGDAGDGDEGRKLTLGEQIVCGWPIVLVFIGGAIGGLCGGAAWVINRQIMLSQRAAWLRYLLVILVGLGAFAAYFIMIVVLALIFPGLFQ